MYHMWNFVNTTITKHYSFLKSCSSNNNICDCRRMVVVGFNISKLFETAVFSAESSSTSAIIEPKRISEVIYCRLLGFEET